MGVVKLELRCPQVEGITVDPEPDWSFDDILSELNSLELKLSASSRVSVPFSKARSRHVSKGKSSGKKSRAFVMRVADDDFDVDESEDEDDHGRSLVSVKRFGCDDLYLSDGDSLYDGLALEAQPYLMEEMGLVEGAFREKKCDYKLGVEEELRNKLSSLETSLVGENEKYASALLRIEKYREARRESDRKLDTQYQRKIAEALDNHLTAIQRDHELRSQIEERKISAAIEGVKRKEKAHLEEKLRIEKAKAEAEAKLRAEEANKAALEAQRRAEKEALEREATEAASRAAAKVAQNELEKKKSEQGEIIKAAENALKMEQERLKKLESITQENNALGFNSNQEYIRLERNIAKMIRQITGTTDVVRQKASDLVKILRTPHIPQSISYAAFARKVVSYSKSSNCASYACAYVVVLITSEIPLLMDLILAELHRACIYSVPKHIMYSKSAFESEEMYYKTIGFQEDEGKIEDVSEYVKRVEAYMKLYGALVQTEIPSIQNPHGLKEGWLWIARFLNTLPPNRYSATALCAFLRMAGYALFRKYKSQFKKILSTVFDHFLKALKGRKDPKLTPVVLEIQSYIEDGKFLQEPEGRSLEGTLMSSVMLPEPDYQRSYHGGGYY